LGGRVVSLAVAFDDVLHRLVEPTLAKVSVVLCLDGFPPALNCSVDFLLESSLIPYHLPLPAVGEVAGVGLWEWRGEIKGSSFCLSKQNECERAVTDTQIHDFTLDINSSVNIYIQLRSFNVTVTGTVVKIYTYR
jgi:hypothetical protein